MSENTKPSADEKPAPADADAEGGPTVEFENDERSKDDDRFNKDGTPAD
jgi:hypothetical protein